MKTENENKKHGGVQHQYVDYTAHNYLVLSIKSKSIKTEDIIHSQLICTNLLPKRNH